MIVSDINQIPGRTYPARRWTRNVVGGMAPIQATTFSLGYVTLEPDGGQVPWHNQEQEEVYFVLEGSGEMCLGEERQAVTQAGSLYPIRSIPSTHKYRRNSDEDDLLLRTGRRCGALASRVGRHIAKSGRRRSRAAGRRAAAAYRSTEIINT